MLVFWSELKNQRCIRTRAVTTQLPDPLSHHLRSLKLLRLSCDSHQLQFSNIGYSCVKSSLINSSCCWATPVAFYITPHHVACDSGQRLGGKVPQDYGGLWHLFEVLPPYPGHPLPPLLSQSLQTFLSQSLFLVNKKLSSWGIGISASFQKYFAKVCQVPTGCYRTQQTVYNQLTWIANGLVNWLTTELPLSVSLFSFLLWT